MINSRGTVNKYQKCHGSPPAVAGHGHAKAGIGNDRIHYMEKQNQHLHEVAITAIIVKEGKYLITRRSQEKKRFPGMWTVPGGKMETSDYLQLLKDTEQSIGIMFWNAHCVVR